MDSKNKQKVILLTTVYPSVEKYFVDFISSVNKQDFINFELVIINDNFKNLDMYINKLNLDNIHIYNSELSPEKNRIYGIEKCKALKADIIVFADADDAFDKNRISETVRHFKDSELDILINDINVCDSKLTVLKKDYVSARVKDNSIITEDSIRDYNFCGLSNSAINSKVCNIEDIIPINPFDWTFFSHLLIKGAKTKFTSKTRTLYRQHKDNFVGIGGSIDDNKIIYTLKIKVNHYKKLNNKFGIFDNLVDYYESILMMDEQGFNLYKEKCYENYKENSFWWEEALKWS
mgnify:CR=1 FL=1|tara:strand:- start:526 stop:1398 length:873 start_codon:yes stop_codon:yes gene_type:complete